MPEGPPPRDADAATAAGSSSRSRDRSCPRSCSAGEGARLVENPRPARFQSIAGRCCCCRCGGAVPDPADATAAPTAALNPVPVETPAAAPDAYEYAPACSFRCFSSSSSAYSSSLYSKPLGRWIHDAGGDGGGGGMGMRPTSSMTSEDDALAPPPTPTLPLRLRPLIVSSSSHASPSARWISTLSFPSSSSSSSSSPSSSSSSLRYIMRWAKSAVRGHCNWSLAGICTGGPLVNG